AGRLLGSLPGKRGRSGRADTVVRGELRAPVPGASPAALSLSPAALGRTGAGRRSGAGRLRPTLSAWVTARRPRGLAHQRRAESPPQRALDGKPPPPAADRRAGGGGPFRSAATTRRVCHCGRRTTPSAVRPGAPARAGAA